MTPRGTAPAARRALPALLAALLLALPARAGDGAPAPLVAQWPAGRVLRYSLEIRVSTLGVQRRAVTKARLRVTVGEPQDGRPTATLALEQLSAERMDEFRAWFFDPGMSSHDGSATAWTLAELIEVELPVRFDGDGCVRGLDLPAGVEPALAEVGVAPDVLLLPLGGPVQDAVAAGAHGDLAWGWTLLQLSPLEHVPAVELPYDARVVERMAGLAQVALAARDGDVTSAGHLRWHLQSGALLQLALDLEQPAAPAQGTAGEAGRMQRLVLYHLAEGSSGAGAAELAGARDAVRAEMDGRVEAALASVTEARLQSLRNVLLHHRMQHGALPEALPALLEPDALNGGAAWLTDDDALLDAWDRPVQFRVLDGRGFELLSLGADGAPGGDGSGADVLVTQVR